MGKCHRSIEESPKIPGRGICKILILPEVPLREGYILTCLSLDAWLIMLTCTMLFIRAAGNQCFPENVDCL